MLELTDDMWWKLCDAGMGEPIPLSEANVTQSFVYDRELGFIYVEPGYHTIAMATLYGFHAGNNDLFALAKELGVYWSSGLAEKWLALPGTCFLSSVATAINVGYKGTLNVIERRLLKGPFVYLFESDD